jgi:hypothetical protein
MKPSTISRRIHRVGKGALQLSASTPASRCRTVTGLAGSPDVSHALSCAASCLLSDSHESREGPILRTHPRSVAGPPGFEPGTLPQDRAVLGSFRVASLGFEKPRGKSITDTYTAPPMLFLTELRAPTLRIPDVIKSILHSLPL